MSTSRKYAIGIDLGGTNLRAGVVSEEGVIAKKIKKPSSEDIMGIIFDSIDEIRPESFEGIGIGVAGLVNRKDRRIFFSPNLHSLEKLDIVREVRQRYRVPVILENDGNAAALGEKIAGAGKGFRNFVMLTLGTGIGGGIIYQDRLLEVSSEIGHMSINSESEKCPCGNTGCLENFASAKAMISKAVATLEKGSESLLKDCCKGSFYKLTPEDIYNAALDGDAVSREILKEAGKYLGVGLANIINLMSPEAVILTGGLVGTWNIYIHEAIREASRRAYKDLFDAVKIIPSSLGDNAGIIGASSLVFSGNPQDLCIL